MWIGSYYDSQQSHSAAQEQAESHDTQQAPASQPVAAAAETVLSLMPSKDVTVPSNFMYVRFSKAYLEKRFYKLTDRTLPVNDTVLGAAVSGTSRTIAHTELQLVENPRQAQFTLLFRGTSWVNSVATSGPVHIHSHGATEFTSTKKLWFDGVNIQQTDAHSTADTNTNVSGISTDLPRLRGRISLRIADRREAESHEQSEAITARHTINRIEPAFNAIVMQRAADFTQNLKSQYAKLPLEDCFAVTGVQCSTSADGLQLILLCNGEKEPVFVTAPDSVNNHPDIEIHVHKSLLKLAVADADLRKALQAAVGAFVSPTIKTVSISQTVQNPQPGFNVQLVGEPTADWISIACTSKDD
jgi:hypothetical protein